MNNVSYFIIRAVDGSIHHEATIGAFAGALLKYEAERELENSTIGAVVHATFDTHLGKRLNTPFVLSEALRALNAQPENYKALTEKVQQVIRTSPEFHTVPGKGGGVARLRDLTPEQVARLRDLKPEQRAKLEE